MLQGQSCFNVTQVLAGTGSRWPSHLSHQSPSTREQPFSSEPAEHQHSKPLISRPSGSVWLAPGGSRSCHSAACHLLQRLRGSHAAPAPPHSPWPRPPPPQRCPTRSTSTSAAGGEPSPGMSVPKGCSHRQALHSFWLNCWRPGCGALIQLLPENTFLFRKKVFIIHGSSHPSAASRKTRGLEGLPAKKAGGKENGSGSRWEMTTHP